MTELLDHIFNLCEPVPEAGCWLWTKSYHIVDGYAMRHSWVNNKRVKRYVHRETWAEVNGLIPPGMIICHKCDTPACVNPDHLFLGTDKDNSADKVKKGRARGPRGERNRHSKLTEAQVLSIFSDARPVIELSNYYGVRPATIRAIWSGRAWSYLTGGAP